jgi:hypothetical protein
VALLLVLLLIVAIPLSDSGVFRRWHWQDDGGDIHYVSFDEETGLVTVKLQGACSTCSSSKVTLKSGVENMLMHYVPEVICHAPI